MLTDPARDIVRICENLQSQTNEDGASHLSNLMFVKPWSKEFFEILSCLMDQAKNLFGVINSANLDEDIRNEASGHLDNLLNAFKGQSLISPWSTTGSRYLTPEHTQPLKMLSSHIRSIVSYPLLTEIEKAHLLNDISEIQGYIANNPRTEFEFLNQIIDKGMSEFRFRLERIEWLGWNYTFQSVGDLINAFNILKANSTDAEFDRFLLDKIGKLVATLYNKVRSSKEAFEATGFALKFYGATQLAINNGNIVDSFLKITAQ